jgi:hypothetical protein
VKTEPLEETVAINTVVEPEEVSTEPEEVIVQPDGKVVYSAKIINRRANRNTKKEKLKEKRGTEFSLLLNQSTRVELECFRNMITERLAKLQALAEKRGKEFPDK